MDLNIVMEIVERINYSMWRMAQKNGIEIKIPEVTFYYTGNDCWIDYIGISIWDYNVNSEDEYQLEDYLMSRIEYIKEVINL